MTKQKPFVLFKKAAFKVLYFEEWVKYSNKVIDGKVYRFYYKF